MMRRPPSSSSRSGHVATAAAGSGVAGGSAAQRGFYLWVTELGENGEEVRGFAILANVFFSFSLSVTNSFESIKDFVIVPLIPNYSLHSVLFFAVDLFIYV
jgi:hypothetical protein